MRKPDPALRLRLTPGHTGRQLAPAFPLEEMAVRITEAARTLAGRKQPLTWSGLAVFFQVEARDPMGPSGANGRRGITGQALRWLVWELLGLTLDEVREVWYGRPLPESKAKKAKATSEAAALPMGCVLPAAFVSIDVEATGSNHDEDRLVEIGLVAFGDGPEPMRSKCWRIDPQREIHWAAQKVHGISNEDVAGLPPWNEKMGRYVELWLSRAPAIVGHNIVSYDKRMVRAALERVGCAWPEEVPIVDTQKLGRRLKKLGVINPDNLQLGVLCRHVGIEFNEEFHHGAHYDALKTGQLAQVLADLLEEHDAADQMMLGQKTKAPISPTRPIAEQLRLIAACDDLDEQLVPEMAQWSEGAIERCGLSEPWAASVRSGEDRGAALIFPNGLRILLRSSGAVEAQHPTGERWSVLWRDQASLAGFVDWWQALTPKAKQEAAA